MPVLDSISRSVRLQSRPGRGAQLSTWLHALVSCHAGYLLTLPDLPDRLSALYALLECRLAPYKKLLRLEGRLGLVMAQVRSTVRVGKVVVLVLQSDVAQGCAERVPSPTLLLW